MTLNAKRAAHFLVHSFAIIARLTLLNLISIICDRRFNLWGNRFIRLSNVPLLTVSSLNRLFITNHTIVSRVFALVWEQCLINLYLSGVLHGWMSRKSQNRGRHHVDKSTWNRPKTDDRVESQVILQYMCQPYPEGKMTSADVNIAFDYHTVRNGQTLTQQVFAPNGARENAYIRKDRGLHEPLSYYQAYFRRQRNKGKHTLQLCTFSGSW